MPEIQSNSCKKYSHNLPEIQSELARNTVKLVQELLPKSSHRPVRDLDDGLVANIPVLGDGPGVVLKDLHPGLLVGQGDLDHPAQPGGGADQERAAEGGEKMCRRSKRTSDVQCLTSKESSTRGRLLGSRIAATFQKGAKTDK